jgi:hypothetical protein
VGFRGRCGGPRSLAKTTDTKPLLALEAEAYAAHLGAGQFKLGLVLAATLAGVNGRGAGKHVAHWVSFPFGDTVSPEAEAAFAAAPESVRVQDLPAWTVGRCTLRTSVTWTLSVPLPLSGRGTTARRKRRADISDARTRGAATALPIDQAAISPGENTGQPVALVVLGDMTPQPGPGPGLQIGIRHCLGQPALWALHERLALAVKANHRPRPRCRLCRSRARARYPW